MLPCGFATMEDFLGGSTLHRPLGHGNVRKGKVQDKRGKLKGASDVLPSV